jgi:MFS family permease
MFHEFFGLPERLAKLGAGLKETFAALKNRDFRVYSIGQLVSVIGSWMQSIALSWLVYSLTGSALMLGIVSFAGTLPVLLLSVFAGGVADRWDRKKIIIITQWLEMAQAFALTVLAYTGMLNVPLLIILALSLGVFLAFEMPARSAYVPALVKSDELVNAIGLNSALYNSCRLFGPALAGVVIAVWGVSACFLLNAVSYVAAIVTLQTIKSGGRTAATTSADQKEMGLAKLFGVLAASGVMNVLFLTSVISLFGFQFNNVLMPVIVGEVLHGQATQLAWLSSGVGVGALVGSLVLARYGNNKHLPRVVGFATLGLAASLLLLGWSSSLSISLAAVAVAGFCLSIQFGGSSFMVQTSISEEMRGRVMGLYSACNVGIVPFGSLLAGWMASSFGVSVALVVAAAACALAAVAYLRRTERSK